MSFRATALKRHGLVVCLLGLTSFQAWSQNSNTVPDRPVLFNDRDGIVTSFVTAPVMATSTSSAGFGSGSTANQWLKVELHYSVTTNPNDPPFFPAITFKVWIEGRDMFDPAGKPDTGVAVALTGSVTYVNVPSGKDCYGVFYVHPNILARYSTSTGYTDFDRKFNIHAEAYVGDELSDYYDKNKEDDLNWYKPLKVIEGSVYRQNQCPFLLDNPDRYPAIKLENKDSSAPSSASSLPPPAPAPTH